MRPTIDSLLAALDRKKYRYFADGRLNVLAVRSANPRAGAFDDWIVGLWRKGGTPEAGLEWDNRAWVATTDPGLYYLEDHLLDAHGCAILVPGQYQGAYCIDLHRDSYKALCQRLGPVRVYRDRNRNRVLDCDPDTAEEGYFGINIHYDAYAETNPPGGRVYKASAGCLVFASRADFREFMTLAQGSADRYGNRFDLTLLEEGDLLGERSDLSDSSDKSDSPPPPLTAPTTLPRGKEKFDLLERWATMTLQAGWAAKGAGQVERMLVSQERYRAVSAQLRGFIPWYAIAIVHHLESSGRWDTHLHNGDPLTHRTYNAPAGRPAKGSPPFTWEESAVDALKLDGWNIPDTWTLADLLDRLEKYNGLGYRQYHKDVATPYLWSGTNHYRRGKYGSDGQWDPDLVSKQVGAAVLLKILFERLQITITE